MANKSITGAALSRARKKLSAAAAVFGGQVEDDSTSDVCLQVCAPAGKVWRASDGDHIVVATAYGPQAWLDAAVADALTRIAEGVKDYPEPNDDE